MDPQLRDLERRCKASGDVSDCASYVRARVRAGEIGGWRVEVAAGLRNEVAVKTLGFVPSLNSLYQSLGWPRSSSLRGMISPSLMISLFPRLYYEHSGYSNEEYSVRLCLAVLNSTKPLWWKKGDTRLMEPDPDMEQINAAHPSTMVRWAEKYLSRRRPPDPTGHVTFAPLDQDDRDRLREDASDLHEAFEVLNLNSDPEDYCDMDWEAAICMSAAALGRLLSSIQAGTQATELGPFRRIPRDREVENCVKGAMIAWTANELEGSRSWDKEHVEHEVADPHVYGHVAVELGGWLLFGT